MTKTQCLIFLLLGYLATVGGIVWLWGSWGLLGAGVASLIIGFFINGKEG